MHSLLSRSALFALPLAATLLVGCTADNTDSDDSQESEAVSKQTVASVLVGVKKVVYNARGEKPVVFGPDAPFGADAILAEAFDRAEKLEKDPPMTRCMPSHSIALSDAAGNLLAQISYTCGGEPEDGLRAVVSIGGKNYGLTVAAKKVDDLAKASAKVGTPCPMADLSTLLCTAGGKLTCGGGQWRAQSCNAPTVCNATSLDDIGACRAPTKS